MTPHNDFGYDGLPSLPPSYNDPEVNGSTQSLNENDTVSSSLLQSQTETHIEQFEVDDSNNNNNNNNNNDNNNNNNNRGIHSISIASHRIAQEINSKIVSPVQRFLDPLAQVWSLVSSKMDTYLTKVGNPLIIKRLIYIIFVSIIIFFVIKSGDSGFDQLGGNSFSGGPSFYSVEEVYNFLSNNVNPKKMEEQLEYFSSMPHIAGTVGDLNLAKHIISEFKNYGFDAVELAEFKSSVNYPTGRSVLKILGDGNNKDVEIKLVETEPFNVDNDGKIQGIERMAFNSLSVSGEVIGHPIYANYGTLSDFNFLQDQGIILDGSIAFIRYGKVPTGLKLKAAQKFNVKGVVFFTDSTSEEDWKILPHNSIQRDSVKLPGELNQKDTVTIPSIPISWNELTKIMNLIQGNGNQLNTSNWVPIISDINEWWTGNITSRQVYLKNDMDTQKDHIMWNSMGKIFGGEQEDRGIIIGAQRDSLCNGAIGPNSGTIILMEVARLLALLKEKFHWRPLRTIFFISWDGSEYDLSGTTEFTQRFGRILEGSIYSYIDLDSIISGTELNIEGHPVMESIVKDVLENFNDPITNISITDKFQSNERLVNLSNSYDNSLPFVDQCGVPTVKISFKGSTYPQKSCYNTFNWLQEHGDKDFSYHVLLTEILTKLAFKLTDEPSILFDMKSYSLSLGNSTNDLNKYSEFIFGKKLNTDKLEKSIKTMSDVGVNYERFVKKWSGLVRANDYREPSMITQYRINWNNHLSMLDNNILIQTGLEDRSWFKNVLFGSQEWPELDEDGNRLFESGSFPGIRDSIHNKDFNSAQKELDYAADLLLKSTEILLAQNDGDMRQ